MTHAPIQFSKRNIQRYPRLDTVLMVEAHIQAQDGECNRRKLWQTLPKQMMYSTFAVIIDYLVYSRKVSIDAKGKVGWIYYPESLQKRAKDDALEWAP